MSSRITVTVSAIRPADDDWLDVMEALADEARTASQGAGTLGACVSLEREHFTGNLASEEPVEYRYEAVFELVR